MANKLILRFFSAGKVELQMPKGKFCIDASEGKETSLSEDKDTENFKWDTLIDTRLLFP